MTERARRMNDSQTFDPFGSGPEAALKRVLLRDLVTSSDWTDDPVPASEVVIDAWRGRVDLALFNGGFHAFEIKSDADRLDRLPRQIDRMTRHFDQVVVLCTERHQQRAEEVIYSHGECQVGLWVASPMGKIRKILPARLTLVEHPEALVSFLLRSDIEEVMLTCGFEFAPGEYAYQLRKRVTGAPPAILRSAALASMLRHSHNSFDQTVEG